MTSEKDAPGGADRRGAKTSDEAGNDGKNTGNANQNKVLFRGLPPALTPLAALPHWVVWRWEQNEKGKPTKVPYQPRAPQAKARNNDKATWSDYDTAFTVLNAQDFDGIGFNLLGTGLAAFDLDKCRDPATGEIAAWAATLVKRVASYTEVTVSGTGLRIIGRGVGPEVHRKQPIEDSSLETYRGAPRYIVMTGDAFSEHDLADIDKHVDEIVTELDAEKKKKKQTTREARTKELPAYLATLLSFPDAGAGAPTGGYPSRSELLFAFLTLALRAEVDDETLIAACLHPRYEGKAIYEHVRDNGGEKYIKRQVEHALDAELGTPFTEVDIADQFAARHEHELRYVAEWGRWMKYDGRCWVEEKTLWTFDLIRALCREFARGSNKKSDIKNIKSAKTIAAVERIAKADRRIAAIIDQWDVDPWVLNTPDGVVDLRTGRMRAHRPGDYLTKMTSVGPGGDCPNWKAHLMLIMNGDEELIAYLQRAFGYSLTGITREHALFFAYGTGANGKGTTYDTVAKILGRYTRTAPMKTFTASKIDEHPTELAMLRGARLVMSSETEEGRSWAESRIKLMTGGDKIPARFMRQDYFEFTPQFKLWFSGNHKPALRSVDEATRRRFNLLPFTVTIAKDKRDPKFAEDKLTAELPGILAWMIEGCLEWQKKGLCPPQAVTDATDEYLQDEDALKRWFMEECVADPLGKGLFTTELYAGWKTWAAAAGEFIISERRFSQALEAKSAELGIQKQNNLHRGDKHGRGFIGVRWRLPNDPRASRALGRI